MKSNGQWRAAAASGVALLGLALALGCSSEPGKSIPYDAGMTEPGPVETGGAGGGGAGGTGGNATGGNAAGGGGAGGSAGQCTVVVEQHPDEGASHIPCTSPADYLTSPPSSGNHYPVWAAYGVYDQPIRWGNLVHNLEHGAVVIVYNCPDGCADELARAKAFVTAGPNDSSCSPPRVILAPDPSLPVRWAASSWTWTLRADCFDDAAFTAFVAAHLGNGRETVCGGYGLDQLCTTP